MKNSTIPTAPEGYRTVMPFIITRGAEQLIEFLKEVFGAVEIKDAFTRDTDGLVLHSELKIGDSVIAVADTKERWPFTPSFLQVYVADAQATLSRAEKLKAKIVTKPTDFFGVKLARFQDPWQNLWWIYEYAGEISWDSDGGDDESWSSEPSKELEYIHATLVEAMNDLKAK